MRLPTLDVPTGKLFTQHMCPESGRIKELVILEWKHGFPECCTGTCYAGSHLLWFCYQQTAEQGPRPSFSRIKRILHGHLGVCEQALRFTREARKQALWPTGGGCPAESVLQGSGAAPAPGRRSAHSSALRSPCTPQGTLATPAQGAHTGTCGFSGLSGASAHGISSPLPPAGLGGQYCKGEKVTAAPRSSLCACRGWCLDYPTSGSLTPGHGGYKTSSSTR